MKWVKPNYNNSIVSLVHSIENYFGLGSHENTLKEIETILKQENKKNVILLLYDGLGYNLLEKNKDVCPTLYNHLLGRISSVFPPTTAAATTSVISGLEPISHGWLGWDMYFKDYNEVVTLFLNCEKDSGEAIPNFPGTSFLLPYKSIADKISEKPNCLGTIVSPFSNNKCKSFDIDDLHNKVLDICSNDKHNFIYGYYENPDAFLHKFGTTSKEVREELASIDKSFSNFIVSVEDSLVFVIADHGHTDIETITLSDYPEVFNMLDATTGIDSRAVSFRVKKEFISIFPEKIKEVIKDNFILLSKEEVIKENWFGTTEENKYFRDGIGDFLAIAISNKAIRYDERGHEFASAHAGITEDEVYVPLVLVKK